MFKYTAMLAIALFPLTALASEPTAEQTATDTAGPIILTVSGTLDQTNMPPR